MKLTVLVFVALLFAGCVTTQQGEWKPSRLYVDTPVLSEDGKTVTEWKKWQLEYQEGTNLLRPMVVKEQK